MTRTGEQDTQVICIRDASAATLMHQELAGLGPAGTPPLRKARPSRDQGASATAVPPQPPRQ
jgi:hypothetical protein